MGTIDLPAGWTAGYGRFNADSGMDADVFTHEAHKLMVRFSYRDDGFVVYQYYPELRRRPSTHDVGAKQGRWLPVNYPPVMPDALSLITWLMVEGVV